jgi:hypothetical protein
MSSSHHAINFPKSNRDSITIISGVNKLPLPCFGSLIQYSDKAAGWINRESGFVSQRGRDFSLCSQIQTGSGAHPACYPVVTACFPMGKAVTV